MRSKKLLNVEKRLETGRLSFTCLLVNLLTCFTPLQAQVTIGGMDDPKTGAILDLNSTVKGGLVLSNVSLPNLYTIPSGAGGFPGITGASGEKDAFKGALVYNTNPTWGVGVYLWNGDNWTPVKENCKALTQLSLTPSPVILAKTGDEITFSVSSGADERCAEGEEYTWTMNSSAASTSIYPNSSKDIEFTAAGTYEVAVSASNRYADPSSKVSSSKTTVYVIGINDELPSALIDGKYGISGISCYDVNSFGDLTKTYTFTATAAYTDLVVLNPGGIVAGVSQPASASGNSSVTFTVTFKSNVQQLVSANGGPVTVKLLVSYKNSGGNFRMASLDVKVQDGECCPGVLIPGGAHVYGTNTEPDAVVVGAIPNNITYTELLGNGSTGISPAFSKLSPAKDLCVYYRDAANGSTTSFTWGPTSSPPYTVSNQFAITLCQANSDVGVDAADRSMKGWRLPNIAELGQMSTAAVANRINGASIQFNGLESVAGRDTRTKNMHPSDAYWSSTELSTTYATLWNYYSGGTYMYNKLDGLRVRCVRTMD